MTPADWRRQKVCRGGKVVAKVQPPPAGEQAHADVAHADVGARSTTPGRSQPHADVGARSTSSTPRMSRVPWGCVSP